VLRQTNIQASVVLFESNSCNLYYQNSKKQNKKFTKQFLQ